MKSAFNIEIILTNKGKPGILVYDFILRTDKVTKTKFYGDVQRKVVTPGVNKTDLGLMMRDALEMQIKIRLQAKSRN